jgi:hypothetical protein
LAIAIKMERERFSQGFPLDDVSRVVQACNHTVFPMRLASLSSCSAVSVPRGEELDEDGLREVALRRMPGGIRAVAWGLQDGLDQWRAIGRSPTRKWCLKT